MADQNTPLQTRSNMGAAIETSLAEIFATAGVIPALGIVGQVRFAVVPGGSPGDYAQPGVQLYSSVTVLHLVGAGVAITDIVDISSEFLVSAPDMLTQVGTTDSSADKLLIIWNV